MFLRFIGSTLVGALFFSSVLYGNQSLAAYFTSETIYQYASQNQTDLIITYLRYGYSIDMRDAYGNTALCQAIWHEDKTAVKNLIQLGADKNAPCLHNIPSEKFYRVGLLQKANVPANARTSQVSQPLASIVWKNKTILGLGLIAATVALIAGGGGGGGKSEGVLPETSNTLPSISTIAAITQSASCPEGMQLINGVCTTPVLSSSTGETAVSTTLGHSPYYLAEFGGHIFTNQNDNLELNGNQSARVIAMQSNGVSPSALSADGTTVDLAYASLAQNVRGSKITMTETSENDKGVIGMYASSAGTIINDGDITIVSKSENESAAMKSDREIASVGVPGTGANIINNGTITVVDEGNGGGTVSAISTPGRGILNTGIIHLLLNTTQDFNSSGSSGVIQGLYGKNILNTGTINLTTNASGKSIHSQVYLIRGFNDQGSMVANEGTLNIDLTNITEGIRGVWSDASNNIGVTIKNSGTINVGGFLYNTQINPSGKQVYLLGSEGGIANTTNEGQIQVGTIETPINVSRGGILNVMNGANGTLTNNGVINFHLYADPSLSSNSFTAQAMALSNGQMINNNEINFSFDNTKGTQLSNSTIQLSAMESFASDPSGDNYTTITNTKTITASLTGSAGNGFFSAMKSANSSLSNSGDISVTSNMDNLDLVGLQSETGAISNNENAQIVLTTSGTNANLIGGFSQSNDEGINRGSIYLKHNGGSGDITGFGTQNNGLIQIEANDMEAKPLKEGESEEDKKNRTFISGGIAYASVSETVEDPIDDDITESQDTTLSDTTTAQTPTKKAQGRTNIILTGRTAAVVNGFEYENGNGENGTTHHSANTINISAESKTRKGDLFVYGIYTGENTDTYRDGILTINAVGSKNPSYITELYGLYADNANITNEKTSVINLNLDLNGSTSHFVAGMIAIDNSTVQYKDGDINTTRAENHGYRAYNAGTINLNITGKTSEDRIFKDNIPFDAVGMLTNSYALNTGTIKLNVEDSNIKSAGMVAFDGGTIVNQGTIIFSGNTANFTPMYATGNNRVYDSQTSGSGANTTTTTYIKDYYATIYNSGKIVVQQVIGSDDFTPAGNGYYQEDAPNAYWDPTTKTWKYLTTSTSADEASAWREETTTKTCTKEDGCETITDKNSTLGAFKHFNTITGTAITTSSSNTFNENSPAQGNLFNETTQAARSNSTENLPTSMRLNNGMRYVSELGGSFEAEGTHLIGDITAGHTLVLNGNKNTYLADGNGQGAFVGDGDASDLSLESNSILFNAKYTQNKNNKNGIDILMTRKSFHELVKNSDLASYLENNYTLGNNETFFNYLKSNAHLTDFTDSLDKLTGKGVMTRFNLEDMTLMRELNYHLNDTLFHNKDAELSVVGTLTPLTFKGGTTSQSKYSLLNKKTKNMSIGLAMAYTQLKSNDSSENDQQETMYQMVVPMNFNIGQLNVVTSPRLGYAYGRYKRSGFNDKTYKGNIEKRVYGLMNEVRYPIHMGNWLIEPTVEFNVLGYTQKGKEDVKDFSLNIKSQNTYSIESGVGLYLTNEQELGKDEYLKMSFGAAAYHEFAHPYQLDIRMNGMQGAFTLKDENASQNHAITRFGIDYINKNYSLYGNFTSYLDKETNSLFKSGFKVNF